MNRRTDNLLIHLAILAVAVYALSMAWIIGKGAGDLGSRIASQEAAIEQLSR